MDLLRKLRLYRDSPLVLFVYYLAIIICLVVLYGKGDFSTPGFIYQGF